MRTLGLLTGAVIAAVSAQAAVDLEWRTEGGPVQVGDTLRIGLYGVADNGGENEPFCAMQVIVVWDPAYLDLLGVDDNGPYPWMSSGFPDDNGLDGLNDTFTDGDAYYHAWANFGDPAAATTEGLLITTFEFEALAPSDGTELLVPAARGAHSVTAVLDDEVPGLNIVDDLGSVTVVIGGGVPGDLDGDGDVDLQDLAILLASYGVNDGGDIDGDGDTDLNDLAILLAHYGYSA
jgi:hypothetical protein